MIVKPWSQSSTESFKLGVVLSYSPVMLFLYLFIYAAFFFIYLLSISSLILSIMLYLLLNVIYAFFNIIL